MPNQDLLHKWSNTSLTWFPPQVEETKVGKLILHYSPRVEIPKVRQNPIQPVATESIQPSISNSIRRRIKSITGRSFRPAVRLHNAPFRSFVEAVRPVTRWIGVVLYYPLYGAGYGSMQLFRACRMNRFCFSLLTKSRMRLAYNIKAAVCCLFVHYFDSL